VKVGTPFGDYPFEFRRIERRDGAVAIVGLVAGLQSSVVLERGDLITAARYLGAPLAVLGVVVYVRRRRRPA
jgi:hypothetical protein